MKIRRTILENISANLVIRLIAYLFSFLAAAYGARILRPEAFGKISFVSSVIGYAMMLADLGMPIYGMRVCAEKKNDRKALSRTVSELWSISILLSVLSLGVLLAAVCAIPRLRQDRMLFLICGSGILLRSIGFEWMFRGLERFTFLAGCQLGAKAVSLLLMLLFIRSGDQLPLYAAFSVLTSCGSDIVCFFAARKQAGLSFRINKAHIRPLLVFFLMSCAVSVYNSLDLTMLGFMKSDLETGLYSVAAKAKGVLALTGGIVWPAVLPQATRLWREGKKERFESLAGKSLAAVAGVQLLLTVVCMIFAGRMMALIGGESYIGAQRAFRILLLSLVPIGISNILGGQVLIPSGHERYLLYAEIAGAVVNFTANLFVIPAWSIEGAAATTVVSEIVVTAICLYFAKAKLRMDFGAGLVRKIARRAGRELKAVRMILAGKVRKEGLPFFCPCCGTRLERFEEGGYRSRPDCYNPARYAQTRQDVICPVCGSLPRHRILALWCEQHREELAGLLYFAPEAGMVKWMKRNGVSFTTADIEEGADLRLDIQDTGLPDRAYGCIVCNHVLEHVDDFRAALKEVYRILENGGCFICSFPMDPAVELLDEDPDVRTDEERIRRFGQVDHRRVFGMQAERLLADAGFSVERICGADCPEQILPVVGPADYDMNILFCCRK